MKKLVIIGAGGFGRETAWLAERINSKYPTWDILGFLDDDERLTGEKSYNYSILGTCEWLKYNRDVYVFCAIGSSQKRKDIIKRLDNSEYNIKYATLIDPTAIVSDSSIIGEGSIVCANTVITVNVNIGKHTIINLNCTIGHEAEIKNFATMYPSTNISGSCQIGHCVELGTGAQIIQGLTICDNVIVGAGAVIIDSLNEPGVYVGVPAKRIK